jgi:hypothetical protein
VLQSSRVSVAEGRSGLDMTDGKLFAGG